MANCGSQNVSVLLGRGAETFALGQAFPVGVQPESITIGDLNADGHPDLAIADFYSSDVWILLGRGDGSFAAAQRFVSGGSSPRSVAVADLNGDGRPDLVTANYYSANVSVLLGRP